MANAFPDCEMSRQPHLLLNAACATSVEPLFEKLQHDGILSHGLNMSQQLKRNNKSFALLRFNWSQFHDATLGKT